LAAMSSIWGMTHENTDTRDGRKVLAPAGYVAIVITIVGLLVSAGSNVLEERATQLYRENAVAREVKRAQQIMIAAQPLTSLNLRWAFSGLDTHAREVLRQGYASLMEDVYNTQGRDIGADEMSQLIRDDEIFPFLQKLASNTDPTDRQR